MIYSVEVVSVNEGEAPKISGESEMQKAYQ